MLDIFEVNRKECARLLLEYPKWTLPGTFKPKAGAPPQSPVEGKGWDLENTLIEVRSSKAVWSITLTQVTDYSQRPVLAP